MTTEEQEEQVMTSSDEEEDEMVEEAGADVQDEDVDDMDEDEEEEDDEENEGPQKREPYNDQAGLQAKLKEIQLGLDWIETLSVSTDTTNLKPHNGKETINKETDGKDDFRREMLFYCQAQDAVRQALIKLNDLKVPTQRPDDYFAEMVKSDGHMQKVRKKLLEKKDGIEASEKAKRQRELKKIGKKVQHNVLQKRQEEKKKMLKEVDRMKKGKSDKLYGDGKDPFDVSTEKKSGIGSKRKHKDEKFGHGGRKRKLKKNSAESASEMSSFKSHIHGKGRGGAAGRGGRGGGRGRGRGPPGGGRKNINHNKKKK